MIESTGLGLTLPDGQRLDFPDVQLAQGQALLLSGPSGSGKSTWLSLVAGLRRPGWGRLVVAGQDLTALRGAAVDAWRASALGFLPQRLHLSESLTVADNLALVSFAAGTPHDGARVLSMLQRLGVDHLMQRRPSALSGGQAQRVALARAVLARPRVLLADEPTASLDTGAAQTAMDLLAEVAQAEGASLVVTTHDPRAREALVARYSMENLKEIMLNPLPVGPSLL